MNIQWKSLNQRSRCYFFSGLVLLAGMGGALLVYLLAEDGASQVLGYENSYGPVFSITPDNSKKFVHDLEVYGGKANVLIYKFSSWFEDLWRGKKLAYTIAVITAFIAAMIYYAAGYFPLDSTLDGDAEDCPDESQDQLR